MLNRALVPAFRQITCLNRRLFSSLWRPPVWRLTEGSHDPFERLEREFRQLEREFDRMFWRKPRMSIWKDVSPSDSTDLERFHLDQPIVEQDGKKIFKLMFDVSQFKPEEIEVKTTKGKLSVSGNHASKDKNIESRFEYFREISVPEGVKIEEMMCKYTGNGVLIVEAPYTPPAVEAPNERAIPIKHE